MTTTAMPTLSVATAYEVLPAEPRDRERFAPAVLGGGTVTQPTDRRWCANPRCRRSIDHLRPQAKTCTPRCRVMLHRLRAAGLLDAPVEKTCSCCEESFTPRRSDAIYCDECRRTERYRPPRRSIPRWERCFTLDGPRLARWLEDHVRDLERRLDGHSRNFQRWRSGAVATAGVNPVEKVLHHLGRGVWEIPDEVWIDDEVGARP